jgi:pantetheine-phosphate adenylyltransferase
MSLMDMPHYYLPAATSPESMPPTDPDEALYGKHGDSPDLFPVVALGGTFDHLHAGHKILLSMAAWITAEKIIVGVTGSNK